ncbi:MAG: AI-2E family transporter [Thermodesulfobacteriota bacterium]
MKKEYLLLIFVLSITSLFFYLFYRILSPFLEPLFWAVIIVVICYPFFRRLQHAMKPREVLPAMIMTLLVVLVVLLPFSLLIVFLSQEIGTGYHSVEEMIKTGRLQAYLEQLKRIPILEGILERIGQSLDLSQMEPQRLLLKSIQQVGIFLFNQSSAILKGLSGFIVGFFFTLLSLYYLFKDGHRLFETLKEILPVPPKQRELLFNRFQEMVIATIYGGILIAAIQGLLGGVSFWILGISSPVFWGTAMAFLSFIPLGGTAFIWVPASLFFFIQGAFLRGLILLAIGIFVISMVDNFLRPFFVGARTKIHPLLLLFAVLGGIQVFGMIGLVTGPLIVSLCLTLIEIYVKGINPLKDPDVKSDR